MTEPSQAPEAPHGPPEPTVLPTPVRAVVVAVLTGAIVSQLVVGIARALGGVPPAVSVTTAVMFVLLAVVVGALAYTTHQQVQVRHELAEPRRAVNLLVLGKTVLLAGAAFTGGYAAYALTFVGSLDAALPRARVVYSALAALASVAVAVAGWYLERALRVPPSDEQDDDEPSPSI